MKILNASLKKGFTLAELLIAMVVIGVIAAVTIAIVVGNAQKTQFVSGLQKASNVFTNVANRSQVQGVAMDTWDYSLDVGEFTNRYLRNYFNIIKDCNTSEAGCFAESYKKIDGSDATSETTGGDFYKFILSDGVSVGVKLESTGDETCTATNPSVCARIIVDVNGLKTPNQWGKDVFEFNILGNLNTIVPAGSFESYDADLNKWTFNETSVIDANCLSSGEYCAAKVLNDGWTMKY